MLRGRLRSIPLILHFCIGCASPLAHREDRLPGETLLFRELPPRAVPAVALQEIPLDGFVFIGCLDLDLRPEPVRAWVARSGGDAFVPFDGSAAVYRRSRYRRIRLPTCALWTALLSIRFVQPWPPVLQRDSVPPLPEPASRPEWIDPRRERRSLGSQIGAAIGIELAEGLWLGWTELLAAYRELAFAFPGLLAPVR
jgi:hypothetical protein